MLQALPQQLRQAAVSWGHVGTLDVGGGRLLKNCLLPTHLCAGSLLAAGVFAQVLSFSRCHSKTIRTPLKP